MDSSSTSASTPSDSAITPDLFPIRLSSIVVKGFGRGSKDLGIPTANVCKEKLKCEVSFESLPCGIYWGFARIISLNKNDLSNKNDNDDETSSSSAPATETVNATIENEVFKAAISIGYNPVYGNKDKTIEPHLIASQNHPLRKSSKCSETQFREFYGDTIRLSIVGYLRPELPFEGLDKLIEAIKNDIVKTEGLADGDDAVTVEEKKWVASDIEC